MANEDNHPPDLIAVEMHMDNSCKRNCENEVVPDVYRSGDTELQEGILASGPKFIVNEKHIASINEVNNKGETALHLSAWWITQDSATFMGTLFKMGANVNARNIWGQTALHYATLASIKNIQKLVNFKDIDVNIQDCNGYNALHCLLTFGRNTFPVESAINILVKSGIDVNSQTNYGNTILHLAAEREDSTDLLKYIVEHFSGIDLEIKNKFGDNFLHIYTGQELMDQIMNVFYFVGAKHGQTSLRKLLNDKNKLGKTPWNIMIDILSINKCTMQTIVGYGINVPVQDSLGYTVLHGTAAVSPWVTDVLEVLIEHFKDINIKNIFGETAGSMLYEDEMFDFLLKNGMKFNERDGWGRCSLVSIMNQHPRPDLLQDIIIKGKIDVNSRDVNGCTPLHFAAYHDFPEQVQLLLKHNADQNAKDNLGDTPIETCIRHCSCKCLLILTDHMKLTGPRSYHNVLQSMPKQIKSSQVTSATEVQKLLGLPKDSQSFLSDLLHEYYIQSPRHSKEHEEVNEINACVNRLVESLCRQMSEYDPIFRFSVYPTGSMSEGIKVGRPDEFDFVVSFDNIVTATTAVTTKRCAESNFVCLKFTDSPVPEKYLPFSDKDGFFLAFPVLQYFFRYLKQALHETYMWEKGNLYYNFKNKVSIVGGKPVFNFDVYWMGIVYKQLKISIDIVPGVYMPGFWPANSIIQMQI